MAFMHIFASACVFSLCMCVCVNAYIHDCVCWIRMLKLSVHWPL